MLTLRTTLAPLALVLAATVAHAETKKPTPSQPEKGRDWSQIDTNKDGHVSPDEMEKWLAANPGPAKGK